MPQLISSSSPDDNKKGNSDSSGASSSSLVPEEHAIGKRLGLESAAKASAATTDLRRTEEAVVEDERQQQAGNNNSKKKYNKWPSDEQVGVEVEEQENIIDILLEEKRKHYNTSRHRQHHLLHRLGGDNSGRSSSNSSVSSDTELDQDPDGKMISGSPTTTTTSTMRTTTAAISAAAATDTTKRDGKQTSSSSLSIPQQHSQPLLNEKAVIQNRRATVLEKAHHHQHYKGRLQRQSHIGRRNIYPGAYYDDHNHAHHHNHQLDEDDEEDFTSTTATSMTETGLHVHHRHDATEDSSSSYILPDDAVIMAVAREVDDVGERGMNGGDGTRSGQFYYSSSRRHIIRRGVAVEYDPDAKNSTFHDEKIRFRLYAMLLFVVTVVIVVGVCVGVVVVKKRKDLDDGVPSTYRESIGIREHIEHAVGKEVLEDPISPYARALEWITHDDPMQLTPENVNNTFVQRFMAAYLWFATTELSVWKSCNPAKNNTNTTSCIRKYLSYDDETNSNYFRETSHAWLSNISECEWAGIVCDEIGQIKSIELAGSGLSGTFPEGIYHLPYLQHIGFSVGRLRGPLPQKLVQNMHHLYSIILSNNQFTGPLPHDWFTSGRHLQAINLRRNRLIGSLPAAVGNLRDLKYLELGGNRLTGSLPTELGLLKSLTYLDISENEIQGEIPESIGNSNNSHLLRLWLHRNSLVGSIPSNIGKHLINLSELSLHTNPRLTGNIPDTIYNLSKLESLDLHDCDFSGTISSRIGNLGGTLVAFLVAHNKFHGTIPSEFANLSSLLEARLEGNDFTGAVPAGICSFQNKEILSDFGADCASDDGYIKLNCSCCTLCCQPGGSKCLPTSSGA